MQALSRVNAVLALVLEVGLLVALVAVGLLLPAPLPVRIAVAVLLPVAVVLAWGAWLAPRAGARIGVRGRLLLETALFAVAVVGLAAVGAVLWAVLLAALVAVRLALGLRLGQV